MESTLSLSRDTAPPLRPLIAGTLFAVVACVLAGPFDTDVLPLPSRLVFWLVLIGWNSVKWWLWYAWAGPRTIDRPTAVLAAVVGALLLNATLPLEIDLMFRAIGRPLSLSWLGLDLMALLVAGSISAQRAGLPDLAGVLSVKAEDHYLRLLLADGRRPLVLFRLSDPLPELAAHDGLQVHRSAWVARRHVVGGRRDGCRWLLVLADGAEQAVSETFLPAVRSAGWLQTKL